MFLDSQRSDIRTSSQELLCRLGLGGEMGA